VIELPPSFVKICGVTTTRDADNVVEAGADALGLIMATSKRHLALDDAKVLAEHARGRILLVGVFRDNDDDYIAHAALTLRLDLAQVHGDVSDALLHQLHDLDVRVMKALAIDSVDFTTFDESRVDAVLVDGTTPGSGEAHSWEPLRTREFAVPVVAAGGLTPDNVVGTIRETGVWGVDTASGVESSPGVKDPTLVKRFVERARQAFSERGES